MTRVGRRPPAFNLDRNFGNHLEAGSLLLSVLYILYNVKHAVILPRRPEKSVMPKLSTKRQITLPAALCRELDVEPGDELEIFAADGRLTLIKKIRGAARGLLRDVRGDRSMSDEESRDSALR